VKIYYEPRLARAELPEEAREQIDDDFDDATVGSEAEISERLKSKWARVEAIVGSEKRIKQLAADIVTHWEARKSVLADKCMVVTMSRRIAVDLYNAIVALRPQWHSDDDEAGALKVVITGDATVTALAVSTVRRLTDQRPECRSSLRSWYSSASISPRAKRSSNSRCGSDRPFDRVSSRRRLRNTAIPPKTNMPQNTSIISVMRIQPPQPKSPYQPIIVCSFL
jgi:hypothetical protein